MTPPVLYVGTYTPPKGHGEGIVRCQFDPATGALSELRTTAGPGTQSASFLALSPRARILYAVNELDDGPEAGRVSGFTLGDDDALTLQSTTSSCGVDPCHLALDRKGRHLLAANYSSGSVSLFPLTNDGSLGSAQRVLHFEGSGPVEDRQSRSHLHMLRAHPWLGLFYAIDLGGDYVHVLQLVDDDLRVGRPLRLPEGTGPRHLVIHPSGQFAYLVGELSNTLSTLRIAPDGSLSLIERTSTLPPGFRGPNLPAEVQISRDGRHLYVSNRGHDSLAHFRLELASGSAQLVDHVSSHGAGPRHFVFDASGRFLLVANERSDSVVTFPVEPNSGQIQPPAHTACVSSPVCLQWAAQ